MQKIVKRIIKILNYSQLFTNITIDIGTSVCFRWCSLVALRICEPFERIINQICTFPWNTTCTYTVERSKDRQFYIFRVVCLRLILCNLLKISVNAYAWRLNCFVYINFFKWNWHKCEIFIVNFDKKLQINLLIFNKEKDLKYMWSC